jgi:hypothetical protein
MVKSTLPANVALSERSQKFYDGTYKWNAEGFTDDNGGKCNRSMLDKSLSGTDETVYRTFDCYDPDARAPTPLPCMFLGDDEDEEAACRPMANGSGEDGKVFTFVSDSKDGVVTVRWDELLRGHANRERLLGKMEGVIIASRYVNIAISIVSGVRPLEYLANLVIRANRIDLSLEECYRLCGIPVPVARFEVASKRGITPPSSPLKKDSQGQKKESTITPKRSPPKPSTFSPSELSDCPSDISEWDESKLVSGGPCARGVLPLLFQRIQTDSIHRTRKQAQPLQDPIRRSRRRKSSRSPSKSLLRGASRKRSRKRRRSQQPRPRRRQHLRSLLLWAWAAPWKARDGVPPDLGANRLVVSHEGRCTGLRVR